MIGSWLDKKMELYDWEGVALYVAWLNFLWGMKSCKNEFQFLGMYFTVH